MCIHFKPSQFATRVICLSCDKQEKDSILRMALWLKNDKLLVNSLKVRFSLKRKLTKKLKFLTIHESLFM